MDDKRKELQEKVEETKRSLLENLTEEGRKEWTLVNSKLESIHLDYISSSKVDPEGSENYREKILEYTSRLNEIAREHRIDKTATRKRNYKSVFVLTTIGLISLFAIIKFG